MTTVTNRPTPLCTTKHRLSGLKRLPNPHPAYSSIKCKVDWEATNAVTDTP